MVKIDWTDDQISFLKENYKKLSITECCSNIQKNKSVLQNKARELGLLKQQKKEWSKEEILYLKENYGKKTFFEILNVVGGSEPFLRKKIHELGLLPLQLRWTEKEINFLVKNYKELNLSDLSKCLEKTPNSIRIKAQELKIKKRKGWTEEEIDFLIVNYKLLGLKEISKKLGKPKNTVRDKAGKLGLRAKCVLWAEEDIKFLKENIKNISIQDLAEALGRTQEAIIYRAREVGIINKKVSIPQLILYSILKKILGNHLLYNDRKTISPYELDIYDPINSIAFEYNGSYWHRNNPNDKIKVNICNQKKINLFIIHEKSNNYRDDIKEQLLELLPHINSIISDKISIEEIFNFDFSKIIYDGIPEINTFFTICKLYSSIMEFRKKEKSLCEKLRHLNLFEEATEHMI